MGRFQEGDAVALKKNHPNLGLRAGAVGVVRARHELELPAYEITFCDSNGNQFDTLLTENDLEVAKPLTVAFIAPGKYFPALLGGCIGAFFLFLLVSHTVLNPYIVHKKRIPACKSNRQILLRLEAEYRNRHPKHHYATDLGELKEVAIDLKAPLEQLRCPAGGAYRVSEEGSRLVIYCTIQDHLPVSQ